MRTALFWMHLGAGILVSALILFFSVTGTLLAYERPLLQFADRHVYHADLQTPDRAPLPLDSLVSNALASVPQPAESLTVHHDPHLPLEITASRSVYFVDRSSGRVQGPVLPRLRGFFADVTALHRWFGLANAHRSAATAVKGATTLLLLFLLLSGAILWLPGVWTQSGLQRGMVPRFDTAGRARNYNWHKVAGFWAIVPLCVVVMTGVIMAYPWANALLYRVAGSPLPATRGAENANGRRHGAAPHRVPAHLDEAVAEATRGIDDWQTASLRLPASGPVVNFTVDRGDGGHPDQREQVMINARTLATMRREPFAAMSRGQRWRAWVRFTHTGEAGGWWGETLALLAACGAIVLSVTGVLLSLDRVRRWRRTPKQQNAVGVVSQAR